MADFKRNVSLSDLNASSGEPMYCFGSSAVFNPCSPVRWGAGSSQDHCRSNFQY